MCVCVCVVVVVSMLATLCGLWYLSSLTRNRTQTLGSKKFRVLTTGLPANSLDLSFHFEVSFFSQHINYGFAFFLVKASV